jgi:hypothetical protein
MERSGIVCLTGGAPTPSGVVVSAQNWLLEVRTKKTTAMDEHQPTTTTHHDLINLLLQDGLRRRQAGGDHKYPRWKHSSHHHVTF